MIPSLALLPELSDSSIVGPRLRTILLLSFLIVNLRFIITLHATVRLLTKLVEERPLSKQGGSFLLLVSLHGQPSLLRDECITRHLIDFVKLGLQNI